MQNFFVGGQQLIKISYYHYQVRNALNIVAKGATTIFLQTSSMKTTLSKKQAKPSMYSSKDRHTHIFIYVPLYVTSIVTTVLKAIILH